MATDGIKSTNIDCDHNPYRTMRVVACLPDSEGHIGNITIADSFYFDMRNILETRIVVSPAEARKLAAALIEGADAVDSAAPTALATTEAR